MTDPDVQAKLDELKAKAEAMDPVGDRPEYTTWKAANPGDQIGGTLVSGEWVSTQYGETPVLVIENMYAGNERQEVWMSSTMLRSFINDEAPALGGTVLIIFDGERPTAKGDRFYKAYRCQTDENDFAHWNKSFQAMLNKKQQASTLNPHEQYGAPTHTPPVVRTQFGPDEAPF